MLGLLRVPGLVAAGAISLGCGVFLVQTLLRPAELGGGTLSTFELVMLLCVIATPAIVACAAAGNDRVRGVLS